MRRCCALRAEWRHDGHHNCVKQPVVRRGGPHAPAGCSAGGTCTIFMAPRRRRDAGRDRGGGMKTLAIVIVSHNTKTDLENCLRSLHDNAPSASHEIIVVDNASRDGSAEAVRSQWPDVRVIPLPANVGFASASNVGIRETRSELVLLLNSDTIVPEGSIDRLIAALNELPGASVVGPKIVDGNGHLELS